MTLSSRGCLQAQGLLLWLFEHAHFVYFKKHNFVAYNIAQHPAAVKREARARFLSLQYTLLTQRRQPALYCEPITLRGLIPKHPGDKNEHAKICPITASCKFISLLEQCILQCIRVSSYIIIPKYATPMHWRRAGCLIIKTFLFFKTDFLIK